MQSFDNFIKTNPHVSEAGRDLIRVLLRSAFVLLRGSYALFSRETSHETTRNAYESHKTDHHPQFCWFVFEKLFMLKSTALRVNKGIN